MALERIVSQVAASGVVKYLHVDQLGSVRLATSGTGIKAATASFDSYGQLASSRGAAPILGYAGQLTDTESGMVSMRARDYDPATGQFTSVDPLVTQTAEAYVYAGDDPVNVTDPTGQ